MNSKYQVFEFNICTFKLTPNGIIPNLSDYPYRRLCVLDNTRNKAIDVNQELEYDYIKTMNGLYFVNESYKKIKENKRAAIFSVINIYLDSNQLKKCKKVIKKLEDGHKFLDGNDALSNEEYLEILYNEKLKQDKRGKVKSLFKRKK